MEEALKQVELNLLVSEGFFALFVVGKNPKTALGLYLGSFQDERYSPMFNVTARSNIDFIDIHHYPIQRGLSISAEFDHTMNSMLNDTTDLNDILKNKPMILGEFGAFYEHEMGDITITANRTVELSKLVMTKGFGG